METTSRLEPHELKVALTPGLYPAEDTAPAVEEWDGLDEIRQEHDEAITAWHETSAKRRTLEESFKREDATGRPVTDKAERQRLLAAATLERDQTYQQAVETVTRLVDEAREQLDDWRAVRNANEAERKEEAERLRARLVELETEDLTNRRLAVWLDRMDVTRVTPGIYPWAQMAATPEPPHLPTGPIAQSFSRTNPQEEDS
jgi:hypothetical protein